MEGVLFAFLASAFWGINGVFLRLGLEKEDVFSSTMTVMLIGSVATFLVALGDMQNIRVDPHKVILLVAAGFVSYFLGRIITYRSIPIVGSSRAYSASSTRILFSAMLGVLILKEEINLLILSGIVMMVSGLYIFTTERINLKEFYISISSGLFFGIASLLIKVGILDNVFLSLSIATFSGFTFLAVFCFLTGRMFFVRNKYILLSAATLTSGNVLFYYALKISPLVITVPLSNLYPVITTFVGFLTVRELERINSKTIAASIVTVFGSILISLGHS